MRRAIYEDDVIKLLDKGWKSGVYPVASNIHALPSVQSEPLRINLNEWIKVKLTDLGREIYYHQFDELNKTHGREIIKPSFPSEDKDGYTRFLLWKFIQLYGAHIGMGAPNVIDPLEIVYEGALIITPEQKTGKWVNDTCSKCGKDLLDYFHFTEDGRIIEEPNYCPNCGAKMEYGT